MARSHFLDDGNQSINPITRLGAGQIPHFVFDLHLHPASNAFEHIRLCRRLAFGYLDLVDVLHMLEVADVEAGDQGDGDPGFSRASRASGAVEIDLRLIRGRIADHMGEVADVDAAGSDIGGDEKAQFTALDALECFFPCGLGEVPRNLVGVESPLLQVAGDEADVRFRIAEDDRALGILEFDDSRQQSFLFVGAADVVEMFDLLGSTESIVDGHEFRIPEEEAREGANLFGNRRGEEMGLSLFGQIGCDVPHIGPETEG